MGESLKKRTVIGTLWSALQKFGTLIIAFVANMILARVLTPEDFGCIAMLAIFIVIADTFVDSGLGSAIIQKKEISGKDLSTVFYFNIFLAVVLYLLLFFLAPIVAEFYKIKLLCDVLRIEGLLLIINSLSVVQTALLRKELRFKELATAILIGNIVAVAGTIVMAYHGFGVWALVLQQLIAAFIRMFGLWFLSSWKPIPSFSFISFRQLFGFGSFIFLSNLINNVGNNIQGLIIGRAFNAGILGYYSQAKKLEEIVSTSVSGILDQVTYPALAKKQEDKVGMVNIIRKMIKLIAFISFPIMIFFIVTGHLIIPLCYGPNWLESVPMFQILCVAGIAICLQGINYNAVAAIGKSKTLFKWTLIKRGIALFLIFVGLYWGIYGLLVGVVLGAYSILLCNAYQVQLYFNYTIWSQIKELSPILGVALLAGLFVVFMQQFINTNFKIADFLILLLLYTVIYIIISRLFGLSVYKDLKSICIH